MNKARFGKVGVLAGGISAERAISLKSGLSVYNALKDAGIDVIFLDIKRDPAKIIKKSGIKVAFIALHGRFGEDGSCQRMLEGLGIPYTGSGPKSSMLAMDKILSKEIFMKNNILIPDYTEVTKESMSKKSLYEKFGLPVIFKPHNEGSSVGLCLARRRQDILKSMKTAFKYSDRILAEKFVDGREITVGILAERALPVVEVIPLHNIYDFGAKYTDKKTSYIVPAKMSKKLYRKAGRLAIIAHKALGCKDFSRVDMKMTPNGDFYILEINTIPGLTERSLLPKAALAAGITFKDLCVKLLNLALKRKGEKYVRIKKKER